jgi:hypothetical protein
MTSLFNSGLRQVDTNSGYFLPLSSLVGQVQQVNPTTGAITVASWATASSGRSASTLGAYTSLLRDSGKTVVSAGRTFRKIQVVGSAAGVTGGAGGAVAGAQSTFGVGGAAETSDGADYLTGYIELGFDGQSGAAPLPVVKYGR